MVSPEGRITTVQAAIAVTSMVTAAGLLTLPRNLAEEMGTPDGWIAVILGGLMAMAAGTVAVKLSQRFPGQTFYQYSQIVAGKGLGILFSLLLILYFILVAGFEARIQAEVVNHYLLDQTPVEVTVLVFLFTGIYLITGGLHPMIRLFQLFFPIILLIFLFTLVVLAPLVEIDNLRPSWDRGSRP